MIDTAGTVCNRAARRSKAFRRVRTGSVAGAAAAAMMLGPTVTPGALPEAQAANPVWNFNWNPAYTAGTLAGLLDWFGNTFPGINASIYNSGPPQTVTIPAPNVPIPVLGNVDINLILATKNIAPDTANLFNTVTSIPQPQTCVGLFCDNANYRYAVEIATGGATLNLADSYRTAIANVRDGVVPPAGYNPFQPSNNTKPNQTEQALIFIQNLLRPNGGLYTRFPELANLLGVSDTTMPAAGKYTSADGKTALNTATIDVTWAYDPFGDFPEVANPFSLLNSLTAALPINLIDGVSIMGDSTTDIGLNLAAVLSLGFGGISLPVADGKPWYVTLNPVQLPILQPLKLPSMLINAALSALGSPLLLGTPIADVLAPAMKILVNIGYDDVVTPAMISADPATYGSYQPYDRTLKTPAVPTRFGSVEPLTAQEWARVPSDVINAFFDGINAELNKPFFGILVPATPPPTASAATALPVAARQSAPSVDAVSVPVVDPSPTATARDAAPHRASTRAASVAAGPAAASARNRGSRDTAKPAAGAAASRASRAAG